MTTHSIPKYFKSLFDVSLAATFLQAFRTFFSLALLFAIPHFINPTEQGLWYLFVSIGALASLADMGLTGIFVVFASHAKAEQAISENKIRYSFAKFVLTWSSVGTTLFFPILCLIGISVLSLKGGLATGFLPWLLFSIATCLSLATNFIISWFEGDQSVIDAFKTRTLSSIINTISTVFFLWKGFTIWSLPIGLVLATIFSLKNTLPEILQATSLENRTYRDVWREWFPQLRPLLRNNLGSFWGGYVTFQAPVVLTFLLADPSKSGAVGFTLNAWMSAFTVFLTLINANAAACGKLWASSEIEASWDMCRRSGIKAIILFIAASACAFFAFFSFPRLFTFLPRMVSLSSMAVLSTSLALHLWVCTVAVFCRAGKSEPFAKLSIASAALSILVIATSVHFQSSPFWGLFFSNLVTLAFCPKILRHHGVYSVSFSDLRGKFL